MKVQIINRKGISGIFSVIMLLLMVAGVVIYATIPFWLRSYLDWRQVSDPEYYKSMLTLLYLAGLPAIFILLQAFLLIRNVNNYKAFDRKNSRYLFWIGVASAFIALLFLIFIKEIFSVFCVVIVVAFILVSMIAFILAELFKIATRYKEENELTI